MKDLIIYGAGGHAKVIADIAEQLNYKIKYFFEDSGEKSTFLDYDVNSDILELEKDLIECELIVAIGNNKVREAVYKRFINFSFTTLIHPSAIIGRGVELGEGSVLMAGVVINPFTQIGENSIINTNASIDHDCFIGAHSHVAPGVSVCGGVQVGKRCLLGVGASVAPGVKIGNDVILGAGAVVVSDVESNNTAVGVPARIKK